MSTPVTTAVDGGAAPPVRLVFPTLVEGAELVGEFKNSGYKEPQQLVSLPNRQLVQLPALLFLVVKILHDHRHLVGHRDPAAALAVVADAVSAAAGARITAEQVAFLTEKKLAPLGITTYLDGQAPPIVKANPFLSLRYRMSVAPEKATWFIGGVFSWLFRPPVVVLMVTAFVCCEIYLFGTQSMGDALRHVLLAPLTILLVLGLAIASCVFHEVGHATACRYSGVRPGVMGCGIYLVWPAFYTDITESYRLGRAGRIRTDLGGVYFNTIFVTALTCVYLYTGFPPLLVAMLYVNFEILQQLLPTLRFDGYYIMSDLCGIPDLFKYIGPILKRAVLRRPADDRLKALKRWPQAVVTFWVLAVFPALIVQLTILAARVPDLVRTDWQMMQDLGRAAANGAGPLELFVAGLQIVLLALPIIGLGLITYQLLKWLSGKALLLLLPRPKGAHRMK
ncbi:hypothetical protein [Actinomadura flavalba]|uniref:hypothetical protein n=1 Tax=Actinomadura flavalba TaxID=1120938 RepID=UPI00039EE5EC|nr:hypothetical protein [Actinomadura flavalba]